MEREDDTNELGRDREVEGHVSDLLVESDGQAVIPLVLEHLSHGADAMGTERLPFPEFFDDQLEEVASRVVVGTGRSEDAVQEPARERRHIVDLPDAAGILLPRGSQSEGELAVPPMLCMARAIFSSRSSRSGVDRISHPKGTAKETTHETGDPAHRAHGFNDGVARQRHRTGLTLQHGQMITDAWRPSRSRRVLQREPPGTSGTRTTALARIAGIPFGVFTVSSGQRMPFAPDVTQARRRREAT